MCLETAFMCQEKKGEKSAAAAALNEAAGKCCETYLVCNLPHIVIKTTEGKHPFSNRAL